MNETSHPVESGHNPEFTRRYQGTGYSVMARPNSCFFCQHLTDIFYDGHGPYAFICEKLYSMSPEDESDDENIITLGMLGKCPDFIDDEEE